MAYRAIPVAIGLLAVPALAKDRPKTAFAPAPVACAWMGPGFVKLEGSDTCVKVSGSVRAEFSTSTKSGATFDVQK